MKSIYLFTTKHGKNMYENELITKIKKKYVLDYFGFLFHVVLAFLLIFISFLIVSSPVSATDYYVAPSGNNNDTGLSVNSAWESPSYAASKARANDTIYILPGTWYGEKIEFSNSGSITHPITLTTYNGTPILDGIDETTTCINLKGNSYININGLEIKNYKLGISTHGYSGVTQIHISNTIVSHTNSSAIQLSNYVSNSSITNCIVEDNGWNSIAIYGIYGDILDPNKHTHNITVKNCTTLPPYGHSAIDLFGDLNDIKLINNSINAGQIFSHQTPGSSNLMSNITIQNNRVYNSPAKGIYIEANNSVYKDNIVYNCSDVGILTNLYVKNITLENNTLYSNKGSAINLNGENIFLINNNIYNHTNSGTFDYRINCGNAIITNPISPMSELLKIHAAYGATVAVEFTNGQIFNGLGGEIPTCYPDRSIYQNISNKVNFKKYPMNTCPTSDSAIIIMNKFNTSLSQGNILINFTVNSTDNNKVYFTISELKPNHSYIVKKDNVNFTIIKANSSGHIQFSNSEWPTVHTFTIEEISSSDEDNSSPSYISPISSAGSDQTVPFGSIVYFNGSESTGDNIVSYEWDFNASNGIQQDAIGAVVNHTYETAGVYIVTLTVTDANGNKDSDTCTVTVLEKSEDATEKAYAIIDVSSLPNNIIPGKTFTVDILVDPSTPITGAQLDFVFNSSMASANGAAEGNLFKQNGAHTIFSGGTVDKSAGKVKNIYGLILGTSNVSSPGTMATINLTAGNSTGIAEFSLSNVLISDASSKSVPNTVTSATVLIDTAPVMNQICCPKSVDEKSTLTFMVSAKDADCDRLTLSTSELPEGACFNRTSGLFTWIPSIGQAGVYTFTFKVSDGYLTDSANVTVTVNKLNYLPIINYFEPLNGSFFSEGERINVSVNASDADGQVLNYSIKIDGVKCSTEPAYIWETDYSSSGNRTIEVAVSDGIDEVKEQHIIFINNYHPRWDVNEDGIVNILDITIIAQNYGTDTKKPYPRWDVNQDGVINIQDLSLAGYYFGEIVI